MQKLIAARPIQYMGRTYEAGNPVPAYDGKMVEAWLDAGSVKWSDTDAEEREAAEAAPTPADVQAADALRAMGVSITDDTGAFVGAENLAEQIRNLVTPAENAQDGQDGQNAQEKQEPTDSEKPAQEGGQGDGEPEMVTGHLDAAQLENMKKDDLEKLAADMGVKTTKNMTKADIAALIAAEEVKAPVAAVDNAAENQAPANQNGGAQ